MRIQTLTLRRDFKKRKRGLNNPYQEATLTCPFLKAPPTPGVCVGRYLHETGDGGRVAGPS